MKAMIFAAGEGTRLRPLTLSTPKALVEVGGEPMLGRVLRAVCDAGASEAVVNVHHLAPLVKEFLAENDFGIPVHISDESDRLLDTGGGLLRARNFLDGDEPILLHNADICTDLDLRRLGPLTGDALLLVSDRPSSRRLLFGPDGRLEGWRNEKTGETKGRVSGKPMAFNGIHLVSPSIFPALERYGAEAGPVFSLTPFYVANAENLAINSAELSGYRWFDIGNLSRLRDARIAFGQ